MTVITSDTCSRTGGDLYLGKFFYKILMIASVDAGVDEVLRDGDAFC